MRLTDTIRAKIDSFVISRVLRGEHSKTWSNLFARGLDGSYTKDRVSDPYAQVISVFNAVKAIADNVPQAKLKLYKTQDKREIIENARWEKLLRNPNPLMSGNDFLQSVVGYLALKGGAFIVKTVSNGQMIGTSEVPAELWVFDPDKFKPITDENGKLTGWKYNDIFYPIEEVVYIKDWNPNSLHKRLPATVPLKNIIDIDYKSLIYNKAFFDNYGIPNSYLVAKEGLGDDEVKRLDEYFKKKYRGASKGFKTAILQGDIDIKQMASTHKDMEFLDQKRYSREEILGAWRVPKALFNITDDLNYATFTGQMKVFWTYGIMPMLRKVEDALNSQLHDPIKSGFWFGFDTSNVVAYQEDFNDKVDVATKLFAMGFTRNEVNTKLELGFDENTQWGNDWWIPFNLVPAGMAPVAPTEEPKQIIGHRQAVDKVVETVDKSSDNTAVWHKFVAVHSGIEVPFVKALKKYFWEQRKFVLKQLDEQKAVTVEMDWDEWDKELRKKLAPHIRAGVDEGVKFSEGFVPMPDDPLLQEMIKTRIDSFYAGRMKQITQVNETVKQQLRMVLLQGNTEGLTTLQIADNVRHVYNMASTRSLLIARTETTASMNGSSMAYYQGVGVKMKKWIVADGEARDTHLANSFEGAIPFNHSFSNGQDFPGSPAPAEEVCNCRCTLVPVVGE